MSVFFIEHEEIRIIKSDLNHNHVAEDPNKLNRQFLTVAGKRKAKEDIASRPEKILKSVMDSSHLENLTVVDLKYASRNIYNERRKSFPVLPKNISDVHDALNSIECKTNKNEQFLYLNDSNQNIVIFTCQTNIDMLNKADTFYIDGTFSYCTKYFCQLFTLHGLINERYIPLIFILLPNKCSYETAFMYLKNNIGEIRPDVTFVVDFEVAIHKALLSVWPESKIWGCRFHLTQSW